MINDIALEELVCLILATVLLDAFNLSVLLTVLIFFFSEIGGVMDFFTTLGFVFPFFQPCQYSLL